MRKIGVILAMLILLTSANAQSSRQIQKDIGPDIGIIVLSSDAVKVGDVRYTLVDEKGGHRGHVIKVGGFLGFGGKLVVIQNDKATRKGEALQLLGYTAKAVGELPEYKRCDCTCN